MQLIQTYTSFMGLRRGYHLSRLGINACAISGDWEPPRLVTITRVWERWSELLDGLAQITAGVESLSTQEGQWLTLCVLLLFYQHFWLANNMVLIIWIPIKSILTFQTNLGCLLHFSNLPCFCFETFFFLISTFHIFKGNHLGKPNSCFAFPDKK